MDNIKKLITAEQYEQALKELLLLDAEYLLKIQCLYELNKFEKLVVFYDQVFTKIEDDYFEILGYYVLSLIELEEYDKALSVLNEELSMPYIESTYEEVLNSLYDDVVAKKQIYLVEQGVFSTKLDEETIADILKNEQSYEELVNIIMRLDEFNVRKIMSSIEQFLTAKQSPVLKTFILEVLVKQQVSVPVIVSKNNIDYNFNPIEHQLVFQELSYHKIQTLLEDHLAKQPSYLNMALDILAMYVYIVYPSKIEERQVNEVAALIEYYIFSLNHEDLLNDFESYYKIEIATIISKIDILIKTLELEEYYSHDST